MKSENLALDFWFAAMAVGVLTLIGPWMIKRPNRKLVAVTVLAVAATILEFISNGLMPNNVNIRADLVLILPLLLVAWVKCLGMLAASAWKARKASKGH